MKRVLHIFNEIQFSGAELMYYTAAPIFQNNGWELLAVSTGSNFGDFVNKFKSRDIKVFHKPLAKYLLSIQGFLFYYKFYKFLKVKEVDVLHIHRSDIYFMALIAKLAKVKTIKTMHNNFKNRKVTQRYAILQRYIARNFLCVKFQTIGESVYNNEFFYYKNPSTKINNWYDSSLFFPKKDNIEKQKIRKKIGINKEAFVIISVGGCSLIKNHFDNLKAVNLIHNKINIEYIHLGEGCTLKEEIKLAQQLGLIDKVHFLGVKANVREYLIASDVYVMPSRFEGLSIASIEAMSCGLPSILYDSPGLRDLINNNDNGFLIEESYELLAEKLLEYYYNKNLQKEKGNNAAKHVNSNYSMITNVSKMIELYNHEN